MGYSLKDVVGAALVDHFNNLGMLVMVFDNGRVLRVWPLHGSQKGLSNYPDIGLFVGQKIVTVEFEMSTKEGFFGWAEGVDLTAAYHRQLHLCTEGRGLIISSISFDVPLELQAGRNYSVY